MTESKPQWPWQTMDNAPKDRKIIVYAPGVEWGLPDIVSFCEWHSNAGFCVDELRYPTMWQEQPGASPDSSPIPPERVPEALRELADLMVPVRRLRQRILAAAGPPIFDHPDCLRARASRLEAELAKGGAR